MRKSLFIFLLTALVLLLAPAARPASAAESGEDVIRVQLSTGNVSRIEIAVEGEYSCLSAVFTGGTLVAEARDGLVTLSHSELGVLGSGDSMTVVRGDQPTWAAFLTLENRRYGTTRYAGDMIFALSGENRLSVINRVGMTAYLNGVVGGELSNDHPAEALKAQTVAAKCFALTCIDPSEPFDLNDTPQDQVYKGYQPANEAVAAAVDAVKNDVLLLDGNVVRCYYCTSNGGQAITPAMRWGKENAQDAAYALTYDPYDLDGSEGAARLRVLPDADGIPEGLYRFLLAMLEAQSPGEVYRIHSVVSFTGRHEMDAVEGRRFAPVGLAPQEQACIRLDCILSDGASAERTLAFPLYRLLEDGVIDCPGANVWFVMPEDDGSWSVVFSRAIGHRVGMSHYGMLYCAEIGFTYDEILSFYYPGATLVHGGPADAAPTPTAASSDATAAPAFVPNATEPPSLLERIFGR